MSSDDDIDSGPPLFGIVANVLSDRTLRTGAKVWLLHCNGDAQSPIVYGLDKSGRPVEKYTRFKRLTNYRAAWIPMHLRERFYPNWTHATKERASEHAAKCADLWTGVRFVKPDSTVHPPDGISTSEAFKRESERVEREKGSNA